MAFGKQVGSKIDRYGSTLAERREAIKEASKAASQVLKGEIRRDEIKREIKSFVPSSTVGSKFATGFKQR